MDTARIRNMRLVFEEAEEQLRLAQLRADCEIPVGCVEELRRACRHIFAYADSSVRAESDEAVRCCERAIFDASEFEILSYSDKFMEFQQRYRDIVISSVVLDYIKWREAHQEARDFIAEHAQNKDRYRVRHRCLEYAEVLHQINKQLHYAAHDLDQYRDQTTTVHSQLQKQNRHIKRLHWTGIILAIILAIGGIIAAAYPELVKHFLRSLDGSTSHTTQVPPAARPNDSPKTPH